MKPVWIGVCAATIAFGTMLIGRYGTLDTLLVGCGLLGVGLSSFAVVMERG